MPDDAKVGESALLCLLSLMRRSLRELTAKFGAIDRAGADRALLEIEGMIARERSQIRADGFHGTRINDTILREHHVGTA